MNYSKFLIFGLAVSTEGTVVYVTISYKHIKSGTTFSVKFPVDDSTRISNVIDLFCAHAKCSRREIEYLGPVSFTAVGIPL